MHSARFSNSSASFGVHQSRQVALRVELAALVVEAVGQLVADHRSDRAEVDRRRRSVVEERRLQDAGGKVDVVHPAARSRR